MPVAKYSGSPSRATESIFRIGSSKHNGLIAASIAKNSWTKNCAALNCFKKFQFFKGQQYEWPLSKNCIREFVSWAILVRKLKASTVQAYISSLIFIHNVNDLDPKNCKDFIVKSMIKGAENLNFYKKFTEGSRKVMTLPLLKILSHQIAISDWEKLNKQVFWTAATVAFFGSFRFGEILCSSENTFHPSESLLWEDVIFKKDCVLIKIKIPKSRNPKGEFIDLFKIEDCFFCPVSAMIRLRDLKGQSLDPKKPVFMFESGKNLTSTTLNAYLVKLLSPVIGAEAHHISGHSFRAALPSVLANRPDLASDEDIKKWGRWNSSCFQLYTRLKPQQRKIIFGKIVSALNNL